MRKLELFCGLVFVAATAVAMFGDVQAGQGADTVQIDNVQANRVACVVKDNIEACERWWQGDPTTSKAYWQNVWTGKGLRVQELAHRWGVDPVKIASLEVWLLQVDAVESASQFNPWSVDFKSIADFEESDKLSPNQKWKWLRYRRAELGMCFEDETMNKFNQCEVLD